MNPLARLRAKLADRIVERDRARAKYRRTGKGGLELRRHQKAILRLHFLIRHVRTPQSITSKGAKFIASFEGFCPVPANIGDNVTTIGIGKVLHTGSPTDADHRGIWIKGQKTPGRLTFGEALRIFKHDLTTTYEPPVAKLFVKGGPLEGKFSPWLNDGLVSASYNLGAGVVTPGTVNFETIGRAITSGSIKAVAAALPLYSDPGTQFHEGLERRRRCEARLILTANYSTDI